MKGYSPLHRQHYEFKYLIPEERDASVRDFLAEHLQLDKTCMGRPSFSFPVHSLYFDSKSWDFYWRRVNGYANNFDLRLRFYGEDPNAPLFLQSKRWKNNFVDHQSVPVKREALESLFEGTSLLEDAILDESPAALPAWEHLQKVLVETQVRPRVHVFFLREAWTNPGQETVQVTLDRSVQCERAASPRFELRGDHPIPVYSNSTILELKFSDSFPAWFQEFVSVFECTPALIAKYLDSVPLLEPDCKLGASVAKF
jgi:SPX domain protein involved in polyphosphate accumulation